jgi:hypothetical protein
MVEIPKLMGVDVGGVTDVLSFSRENHEEAFDNG